MQKYVTDEEGLFVMILKLYFVNCLIIFNEQVEEQSIYGAM